MKQQQQSLLEELSRNFTGDFKEDITYIVNEVKEHFKELEKDEALRKHIEKVLLEAYPEESAPIQQLWMDLTTGSDDAFIQRMNQLVAEDRATDAQFEMNVFINAMESEFKDYKPKLNVKYYSVFNLIDLFIFSWYESAGLELRPTKRDYSRLYIAYAEILMAANEWQEAADAYQQALLWNPYNAKTIFNLAGVYLLMEQYGMSYATLFNGFRHAIRREDFSRGMSYLAYFYEKKGEKQAAAQLYYISLAWDDNNSRSRERLNHLQEKIGQVTPLEGEELLQFKKDYRIVDYPNPDMVNALKAVASRSMIMHAYQSAYVYYGLYLDLVEEAEDYIVDTVRQLDKKLKNKTE